MNTRRLTKKYKHKSRSRNKSRKTRRSMRRGKTRRRVLKGGAPKVRPSSVRPGSVISSSFTGISKPPKPPKPPKLDFKYFYDKLMTTDMENLPNIIGCERDEYVRNTTLHKVNPSQAFLNINGLKFISYLRGKYSNTNTQKDEKEKIKCIVSLFDQCNMSQGVRYSDLAIIESQVDKRYYAHYEKLYNDIYKKLFPNGNSQCYPVALPAILHSGVHAHGE